MSGECEQFARPMHGAKYPKEANTDKEHDLGLERQELRRQEGSRQDAPQELRREVVHHRPVRQGSVNSLRGLCMGLSIKMRQTPTKSTNLVGSDIILTKSTNLVGSNIILFIMLGSGRLKEHTYFCNFCSVAVPKWSSTIWISFCAASTRHTDSDYVSVCVSVVMFMFRYVSLLVQFYRSSTSGQASVYVFLFLGPLSLESCVCYKSSDVLVCFNRRVTETGNRKQETGQSIRIGKIQSTLYNTRHPYGLLVRF